MTFALGDKFHMPDKRPDDPDVVLERKGDHYLWIRVGDQTLHVSEFNAARLCGLLSLFLNLRFVKRHATKLRLW